MTEQETINNSVQMQLALQDAKFNQFVQEMKDFKEEMKDFKQEMRDRDNQRHAEISEMRQNIASLRTSGWVQTGAILLGIAAMIFTR